MIKQVLSSLILIASISVFAQDSKIEITPSAGYLFSSRSNYAYADLDLKDNYSAGLALSVRLHESALVEVIYHTASTDMNAILYDGIYSRQYYTVPYTLSTYHIGGVREFSNEKVRLYTSFSLGTTLFQPTGDPVTGSEDGSNPVEYFNPKDIWTFSIALGGGAKVMFSEKVGLRVGAKLMLPMYFNGVGIYCGSGCGGGASFGAYFVQLDLSGGLIIALGQY